MRTPNFTNNSSSFSFSSKLRLSVFSALMVFLGMGSVWGQTLLDSYTDGNFTASPVWGGSTSAWAIQANSDAAAGATGSNTLRLASTGATTVFLSTQVSSWGTSQEWGFWVGRRGQAFSSANQMYIWLYANEATLNNATVDGYRIAIGDNTGGDDIRLEYIVNGAVSATVIASAGTLNNDLTDIGFLIRVTRSSTGGWEVFTSTLPTANGNGAIASTVPNSTNAPTSGGTGTNNSLVPATNGYLGVAALHSSGVQGIIAVEFDQVYFTPATSATINVSSLNEFTTSTTSTPSSEQTLVVSGTSLTNDISIVPPTGFEISTVSGGGFTPTNPITITAATANAGSTNVYVRYNPASLTVQPQVAGTNITATSTGASTQNVTVLGSVRNLSQGDFAVIGFNCSNPDAISFVALSSIPANTIIKFTDNGYSDATTQMLTEGYLIYTAPSTISAGTVVSWNNGMTIAGTGWNSNAPTNFSLNGSGEQLFAFQGTWGVSGGTTTLHQGFMTGGTWTTLGSVASVTANSYLPTGLTTGTSAADFANANAYYTNNTTNTVNSKTTIFTRSSTAANWTSSLSLITPVPNWAFNIIAEEPTTQPSFSAATSVGNNQMTLNFSGGNGTSYMVVMREGSAVTATPTDATNYSSVSGSVNFSTATELSAGQRIVYNGTTATGSVTVTNLAAGTTYHYAIYAYNGTTTTANFYLTAPGTGNQLTTGSTNSNLSDIIIHTSFIEPSNIAYASTQENSNLTVGISVEVAQFTLRDGGATTDADANSTTLNSITFTISNHTVLRRLALYDGSTELGEIAISSGTATFSGLTLIAGDNSTKDFSLRASFAGTVTDNAQFSFTISSVTADIAGSTFAAADAGAAVTSTTGDRNKIEVTSDRLAFVQIPSNVATNTAMTPAPTVSANDALANRDLDYVTDMAATTTGTFAGASTNTVTPVAGLGTFSNLQFSVAATARTIAVSSGALTATGNSSTFDVTISIVTGDIAFVKYQSDAPDEFSVITFVDIPASQTFYFTDNQWTTASGPLATTEQTMTWTTPVTVIPAGTVITFLNSSGSLTTVTPSGNGTASLALNGISASGDQIFMYKGTSGSPSQFICGLNFGNSGAWQIASGTSSSTSFLPADLTNNVNAISFASDVDNGYYGNTMTGSIATLKSLINNGANWTRSNDLQTAPTWSFTINATTTTLTTNGTVENLSLAAGETFETGANTLTINGSISGSGQIDASSGTVAFRNTSNLSLPTAFFTGAIANLSKTAGAGTLTLNDALTTVGNLSTTASTGAVILAAGKQLTLTGALVNNGAMTIESGGTFKQGTSVTGNGTYNVQQYLTGSNTGGVLDGRFWYMGVPLNVTRTSSFGDETTLNRAWTWSETGQQYGIVQNGTTLTPTTGIVYRRGSNGTVNFNGSGASGTGLYAQDATLTGLTKTGAFYSGYHLLANPYTAYLDFEMMNGVSNNMSSTIWTRAAIGSSASMVFDTYNATSNQGANPSGGTSNQYIAPMQAFWVRVAGNTGTTGNISMTRAMTSHDGTGGLKSGVEYPAFARVNVVDGPRYDQTLVYLRDDQNNAVDAFDSEKMFASGLAQVYTMAVGKKLVMNGLKNNKKRISVPLYFDLPSSKVYELTLAEFNMENGIILLEDKQEGIIQDFTINDHYAFYASSGTLNNRFVLHFYMPEVFDPYQAPSNNWANPEPVEGGIFIGSDGRGKVLVELELPSETQTDHVQILNAAGQVVFEADLNGAQTEFDLEAATGIYLVKVTNGTTTEIKKIIIQH